MSRTYVHAPPWVKQRQKKWRPYFYEFHDHSSGMCDLDAALSSKKWSRTNCCLLPSNSGRNIFCGCGLCTGQSWRRWGNRARRQEWRSQRQRILAFVDKSDVDVVIPRIDTW